jgi:cytochrome c peroxidase
VPGSDDGRFKDIPPLQASALNAASSWSDDPTAGAAVISALDPANEANRAAFRTPSLRGVADSAPYMHSGQLATLAAVVDFYAAGGGTPSAGTKEISPISLDAGDKQDLVAFLMTLTGEAVTPGLRSDTSQ